MKKYLVLCTLFVAACTSDVVVPSGVTRYNGEVTTSELRLSPNVVCGGEYYDPQFQRTYKRGC